MIDLIFRAIGRHSAGGARCGTDTPARVRLVRSGGTSAGLQGGSAVSDPSPVSAAIDQRLAQPGVMELPAETHPITDDDIRAELQDDPGWWRVEWPDRAITWFRSHDRAVELTTGPRFKGKGIEPKWVQEI